MSGKATISYDDGSTHGSVEVAGEFNNWTPVGLDYKSGSLYSIVISDLTPGASYMYKFIVDNKWLLAIDGRPISNDPNGNANHILTASPATPIVPTLLVQDESQYKTDPPATTSDPSTASKTPNVPPPSKPSDPPATADEHSESSPETLNEDTSSAASKTGAAGTKPPAGLDSRHVAELDEDSEEELDKFHEDEDDDDEEEYDNNPDDDSDVGTSSRAGSRARAPHSGDGDDARDVSQQEQQNSVWIVRFFSFIFGSIGQFFSKIFRIFESKRDAPGQQQ